MSPPPPSTTLSSMQAAPYRHDFFAAMRLVEALHPQQPRLGTALRPSAEPVRLGQDPAVDFAPAALSSWLPGRNGTPRIGQRFHGLFGPMGPLPLHLTEHAQERRQHHGDRSFSAFADLFHHRALLMFYRAWVQSRPAVHLDRRGDAWSRWLGSLAGFGDEAFSSKDSLPDEARRHRIALLARGARSPEGLVKLLQGHFRLPVRLEPWVGHWMLLRPEDRTRLQAASQPDGRHRLGHDAIAGSKVWDRQFRFRLHLGPLSYTQYRQFLPGARSSATLRDWVRQHAGLALAYDVVPWLRGSEVPPLQLGHGEDSRARLGWTSWLGSRRPQPDRGDLRVVPERQPQAPAAVPSSRPLST